MVTPRNLSNLNQRQLLQLQQRGQISSQAAADEIVRRRQAEADRKRRDESRRERIEERTKGRELIERAISTPEARQEAERVIQAQRRQETQPVSMGRVAQSTTIPPKTPVRRSQGDLFVETEGRTPQSVLRASSREPAHAPPRTPPGEPPLSRFTTGNQINVAEALIAGVSPATLQREGGFKAEDIRREQLRANAIKEVRRFADDGQVDLNRAVRRVDVPTLERAGISQDLIDRAKKQNQVTDKLKPYTDKQGNVNLEAAKRGKVDNQTLRDAGFTKEQIKQAQLRVVSLRRLRPYATKDGYDIVSAIDDNVNRDILRRAGFTNQQITEAEELNRHLNPAPGSKRWYLNVGKEVGITAADAIVPGLWVRNWNKLSNTERATNIALDALFVVPFIGLAAKGAKAAKVAGSAAAAARAAKRSSKAAKALRSVRQAERVNKVEELRNRITRIDNVFKGQERRAELEKLLKTQVESAPKPRGARAVEAEVNRLQDRIDRINEAFAGAERRRKLDDLLNGTFKDTLRNQDAALLRSSEEVANIVLRKTGSSALADDARRASLEVGEALVRNDAKGLKAGAKRLALVGRKSDIKALTSKGKALEAKSVSVSDFFKAAKQAGDDLPTAPKTVKDRINRIDEFFDGVEKLDVGAAKEAAMEKELLQQEVRLAEKKLKDLERRKVGSPRTKELLKERIQRTKVQIAERPAIKPKLQTLFMPPVAGPLAKAGTKAAARTTKKTRGLARAIQRSVAGSTAATNRGVKLAAAPLAQIASKTAVKSVAFPVRATKVQTLSNVSTKTATKTSTKAKQATKTSTKVKPVPKVATKTNPATKTATKVVTKTVTQPLPKVEPQPKVQPQTKTKVVTRTMPKGAVKTQVQTKIQSMKESSRFKLPNEREEKKLKPGEFPRVVTWQQGLFDVTVDIDKGVRSFQKASTTGKKVTPDSTFKIVSKDKTRPTPKVFRQGVVDLTVTPNSLAFKRRTRNGLK